MPEYLWYTLAATLAGVGTGLVGLSAATAMVPILIVSASDKIDLFGNLVRHRKKKYTWDGDGNE